MILFFATWLGHANWGGGRLVGLPYYVSTMSVRGHQRVRYRSRRIVGGPAHHDIVVVPGEPVRADDPVAFALAGRWRASVEQPSTLASVNVEHEPGPCGTRGSFTATRRSSPGPVSPERLNRRSSTTPRE
jgi:uncharacterized protein YqjF (DUF2071 family)